MDLSIVIVNWNTRDLLRKCLRSIEANSTPDTVETIVVDNKSADGSGEMVVQEFPRVKLIHSGGNLGFGKGSNLGLKSATGSLVLFLNPDTEILDDALRKMVAFINANPSVGALGCKIRDAGGGIKQLGLQWFPSPLTELIKFVALSRGTNLKFRGVLPYHDPEVSGCIEKLYGACLLVRKSVLDQVGGFDERFFMYCEDVDLCKRITNGGWKLYYQSDVEILHWGGSASSKAPGAFAVLMTCESFSKLMRKYHGFLGMWAYRLVAFLGAQLRIMILLLMALISRLGLKRGTKRDLDGSLRKHFAILKWTLGLQKAVVKN